MKVYRRGWRKEQWEHFLQNETAEHSCLSLGILVYPTDPPFPSFFSVSHTLIASLRSPNIVANSASRLC